MIATMIPADGSLTALTTRSRPVVKNDTLTRRIIVDDTLEFVSALRTHQADLQEIRGAVRFVHYICNWTFMVDTIERKRGVDAKTTGGRYNKSR